MMLDSEQMVTGSLLVDGRTLGQVRGTVELSDFRTGLGQGVFAAACALADENKPVDPVTIREKAAELGLELDRNQMLDAMELCATTANLDVHLTGMKQAVLRSELLDCVSGAQLQLMQDMPPDVVCAGLQAGLERAAQRQDRNHLLSSQEAVLQFADHRIALESGRKSACISTGYNALDNALGGGFVPESLNILAARPGCGKTTLGLQMAEKAAAAGTPTLFLSLEMPVNQLTARRLAVETGIPAGRILMHRMSPEEHQQVANAMDRLQSRPLFFNREKTASVGSIGVQARQVKNCGLVVVDYLGLLQYEPGRSLYEQVTKTSNSLKRLAASLGIPILCLAQLNREAESRKGPPRLSDLRDSGAIEQDADCVLLLHRPQAPPGEDPVPLLCTVAKNRHGAAGDKLELNFYLCNGRIRSVVRTQARR